MSNKTSVDWVGREYLALSLDGVFQFFSEPDGLETAVTSYLSIDGRCDISKFFSRLWCFSISSGSDILQSLDGR